MSVILASAGYDHTIRFWEALSGICSRTIQHPDSQVNRLAISPDKRFLAAAGHLHVRLYDIRTTNPNPVTTFEGHTNNVTAIAFQSEGKWLVSSSEDGTVKVWDMRAPTVQRNYKHKCPVNDVVIHPNQGELVSCDENGNVRIWDLGENTCTHHLIPEEDVPVRSVSVASDASLLVAANNKGNCYVWRMISSVPEDGNNHLNNNNSNNNILDGTGMSGTSSPSSGGGATVPSETILQPITKLKAHSKYITKIVLSPDVKHLATCSADHTARIWSTQTFEMETCLASHQRWVWDCAFSADSAYLVTASSDHYARLWDLSTSQIIRQYNGHHKGAVCVVLNDV